MTTIKPLPQSLSSLVRSGIVLFDLTRVVEELVFNSLDASAKKVSVFVGVGNFSLKVVDNGSGVTRDDLVLLGGRYATSKCWPSDDTGTTFGSFGSRGEALASISDVSLIEMITKTHGSPNGYRKILKGCKCLHLGIDDDIQDVGTTVIVRDLFYNQPIRRKYIQSSPRKVLDSIKKCILRIALVNTEISFKVVDIESGNELLCTEPSSSPLSLLQRTFGIDICNALRELKASEGVLNLTGHISGPGDDFSFKDWNPILAFVENAVQQFWKEREPEGRYSHTFSEASGQNLENCVSGREGAGKLEGGTIHCSAAKQQSSAVSFSDRQEIQKYFEVDPGGTENDKDSILGEIQESRDSGVKWRETCLQTRSKPLEGHDESNILDISSGFLHLAGDSLVPKSISKDCLFNAKVLQQVDKKFIPVVGGGALVVIDQHAADERIRLEDLRQKVLSGEVKTISYLDSEKELLLPEIGYQLLRDYGEQIKEWGWICNIHSQCSGSFTKNLNLINRQRTAITLLAVPCILGVNLTDVDLLEFLQQLVDTDGASTMPPAVVRVLNLKACRGAIMFGDSLLPSECSLIVEELKQTSLCFQCAHGRPTTVPLVNLDALHKQIPKLCGVNAPSNEPWHGLRRHGLSLQRSARRLRLAMS
ncbi:hypothetical protein CRG98_040332 [Punica granatum]|uniref:MutL C-terminal dimerisation domain-containing protein n=1 Tax=Punica granatum TaxID=22663 RepID=A0A2I0I778_PUNGR|nr:hypothetical protein CRG98_040332 [Punica granatum]